MKILFTILMFSASFLFIQPSVFAQDSAKSGAVNQINKTSEQADKLYGKKIQQKSLSTKPGRLDTVAASKTKKKTCIKHKRKHR